VTFVVDRAGKTKTLKLSPIKDTDGVYRVGVFVGYRYDFPVDVKIYLGNVTGPSAGLMFSLSLLDLMTPGDLAGGHHVAGTGTISPDGEVGAIGGIRLKMIAARNAGASYFLAPKSNCSEIIGHIPKGLTVRAVDTYEDALTVLSDLEQNIPISPEVNCPTK
jgi:PDZ domain-containing protein